MLGSVFSSSSDILLLYFWSTSSTVKRTWVSGANNSVLDDIILCNEDRFLSRTLASTCMRPEEF